MTTSAAAREIRDVIHDALAQPTLCAAFEMTAEAHADETAIRLLDDSVSWTWTEYRDKVRAAAAGLAARGLGRGDAIGLLLTNRPEVYVADAAAMHLGTIAFSVYHTNPPEQIVPLLENSGARVLITEPHFLDVARGTRELMPGLELIVIDGDGSDHETFESLCAREAPAGWDFEAAWRDLGPDDLVTIVYTSGTTGSPKGVQHNHGGLLYGLKCMYDFRPVSPGGRVVSYLPMAHIAERFLSHYCSLVYGLEITCCPDPKQLGPTLAAVHPTRLMGVPRIYEKLATAVRTIADSDPEGPLAKALEAGGATDAEQEAVLAGVRAKLGLDQCEWTTVAAAPTPIEVLELFHAIGVDLLEFWGMSECMFSTCNPPGKAKLGTVGVPVPGVQIKLADDGELLVRGKNVMVDYRRDPEQTAQTIDADGWMHSGDIAQADEDGYLRIVDRKKELIINSAGKNMAPSKIETVVKATCSLIAQVVAIGDRRPYVTALVVLDPEACAAFAAEQGIAPDVATVAGDERARALVADAVARGNERLARVEQVKAHAILPHGWEPGGDELTPTMKLKRRPISEKYAAEIDALYSS
jgi:long-subunit acyl-CoA synthetase (AMP-forming)